MRVRDSEGEGTVKVRGTVRVRGQDEATVRVRVSEGEGI